MSFFVYLVIHGAVPVPVVKSMYPTYERARQDKERALAWDPTLDIRISSVELPIGNGVEVTDEGLFSQILGVNP